MAVVAIAAGRISIMMSVLLKADSIPRVACQTDFITFCGVSQLVGGIGIVHRMAGHAGKLPLLKACRFRDAEVLITSDPAGSVRPETVLQVFLVFFHSTVDLRMPKLASMIVPWAVSTTHRQPAALISCL